MRYVADDSNATPKKTEPGKRNNDPVKKISKSVGEYVDYEELNKK